MGGLWVWAVMEGEHRVYRSPFGLRTYHRGYSDKPAFDCLDGARYDYTVSGLSSSTSMLKIARIFAIGSSGLILQMFSKMLRTSMPEM